MSGPNFSNPVVRWIEHRLPVFSFMHHELHEYPTPKNLNYWWNFGSLAGMVLVIMLVTGIVLAMHYTPHVDYAFASVERIMRDVNYGWLIRYIHSNGASFFFIVVYIHIFRGLYYGSYKAPRELLWILGVVILLLMMATAFMGYVLPWGQMSFWGATVITNLFSAVPGIGDWIVTLLWGGFAVDNPTLNRFYSLHYLLPFLIVGVVVLHVIALHRFGSNNPLGIDLRPAGLDPVPSLYTVKDMSGLGVFLIFFSAVVFFMPNVMGHADNYIRRPAGHAGPIVPSGTSCRSTPSCAPFPTSCSASSRCSRRSGCCSSCHGLTARRCAARVSGRSSGSSSGPAGRLRPAHLSRRQGAGGDLCRAGPDRHGLLLLPLPAPAARAVDLRDTASVAAQHQSAGSRSGRFRRRSGGNVEGGTVMRAARSPGCGRNRRALATGPVSSAGRPPAAPSAGAGLVVFRRVRHLRPRGTATRLPGLRGGLCRLPFAGTTSRSVT